MSIIIKEIGIVEFIQDQEDENKYLREEVANLAYTNQKITQSMSYMSEQFSKIFETLKFLTARSAPTARPSGAPTTGPSGAPGTGPGGAPAGARPSGAPRTGPSGTPGGVPTGPGGAPVGVRPGGAPTSPAGASASARPGGAPTGARPGGAPQPVSAPRAQEPFGTSTQPSPAA